MARRSGIQGFAMTAARAAAQQAAAQAKERARIARQLEREAARQRRDWERNQAQQYLFSRTEEADRENRALADRVEHLQSLLVKGLDTFNPPDLNDLKHVAEYPLFDAEGCDIPIPRPELDSYLPSPPTLFQHMWPSAKKRYDEQVAEAHKQFSVACIVHREREAERERQLEERRLAHNGLLEVIRDHTSVQHAQVDAWQAALAAGDPDMIVGYSAIVLDRLPTMEGWPDPPDEEKIAYVPASKQVIVEFDLPPFDVVPEIASYRYVKATDQITTKARPQTERRALYNGLIAQVTLQALHQLFASLSPEHVETIVFNGCVTTIDPGTGQAVRPCLVTVRVTRDLWSQLDLRRVDAIACLKVINAAVSKSPSELAPVRPVLELSMVDPRFIEQTNVLAELDQRPNLMDLTPGEFEALIANLFQTMGLETRLTQASRDGGVDCVAYDNRAILGGKVVIQAKHYKHTVGVSAVRDLFGTVQNEGASKGILVTTSGYGKAAFDFALGKPLELLDGSNLLYLLAEHAGIEAKIDIPDEWKDPHPDMAANDA